MADEIIEAAARAISFFLGEGALRSSAAELTRLALTAVDVADGGVPRDNLKAAAEALSQAGSAGRSEAVAALLNATANLERTLGVKMDALRVGASELALACRDHLKAAEDTELVRLVAAALEEQERSARARPWWWRMLRSKGAVQRRREQGLRTALLAEEDPPPSDRAEIAAELLREEWWKYVGVDILPRARILQQLAVDVDVPHHHLERATQALVGADKVIADLAELSTAATELEEEATELLCALRAPVAQLAVACLRHQQAAEAMEAVQRAAEERAQQRADSAGGVLNEPPSAPDQGNQWEANMQGYALSGWFSLVPYLAASTGTGPPKALSTEDRWKVNLALSLCITIVATGALLTSTARSCVERFLAMVSTRVGMFGINIFTIYFVYWILGINDSSILHISLGISCFVHFCCLILGCVRAPQDA